MAQVHKLQVITDHNGDAKASYFSSGEFLTIGGKAMVQLSENLIVSADGYFGTKAEAREAAAAQLDSRAARLVELSKAMRERQVEIGE